MSTKKSAFTKQFVGDMAEQLDDSIDNVLECYGIPEVKEAKNNATMLSLLIAYEPEKFLPGGLEGYNREVIVNLQDALGHMEKMAELAIANKR